jgi:WD domain, G-beta repeat
VPRTLEATRDWAHAHPYTLRHLATHAAAAGTLDPLLDDAGYLIHADPATLLPALDAARSAPARAAALYRQSAHLLARLDRPMRASQLELAAHRLGHRDLAARIAAAAPTRAWQTGWSHGRRTSDHQVLTSHTGVVRAVAVGELPDGTPVIVSSGNDTVRVWRLADGTPHGKPITGNTDVVCAVAVGALPDGTPVIVSGSDDGTVRVWRLADGTPHGKPLRGHTSRVQAVAVGVLPDGTPVIVSGDRHGMVRVWRLADGTPHGKPLDLSESIEGIALHGKIIITASGRDIAVHQPAVP